MNNTINWMNMDCGRHYGKTLPQIIFDDPDYVYWLQEQAGFIWKSPTLKKQAAAVAWLGKRIRIPAVYGEDAVVIINTVGSKGKFAGIEIYPQPILAPYTMYKAIDLSKVRAYSKYDKTGGTLLKKQLKSILFKGHKNLTRALCDEFFSNVENFVKG